MGDFAERIKEAVKAASYEWENRFAIYEVMEVESCGNCDGRGFHLCDKVVRKAKWLAPAITVRDSEPCEDCEGRGYHDI